VALAALCALASVAAVGMTTAGWLVVLGPGSAAATLACRRRRSWGLLAAVVVVAAVGLRAEQDLAGLARPLPGHVDALAELGSDPEPTPWGASVVLVADGRRWSASVDRDDEPVLRGRRAGDRVRVTGTTSAWAGGRQGWATARHLAGRLRVSSLGPGPPARPWFRAANGVHELLERGSASIGSQRRPLYLGLVVGDDRGQAEVVQHRFRAAGLSHLLAVSGQNVAFVLVVLSPLSGRLPRRARLVLGLVAIAGFVLVTRAEPSVLRAAVMASVALGASTAGRVAPGLRVVALSVAILLVADPLLVWSVGFRLSVGATLGLVLLARPLAGALPGPAWLARASGVTLAAQAGALPVSLATFGPVSLLSVPANVLAEPAAGAVMTLGMSTGLLAGMLREEVAAPLQFPVRLLVAWIDLVASGASSLSVRPTGAVGVALVAAGVAAAVALRRARPERVGSALCLALLPLVLLTRPPPAADAPVDLAEGVALVPGCGRWWIEVDRGEHLDDRRTAEVLDALWARGLGRVDEVRGGPGAAMLAEALRARPVSQPRSPPSCR
jgi:competence protein ComEC